MQTELVWEIVKRYWEVAGVGASVGGAMLALKLAANHLSHIQESGQQTVAGINRLITAVEVHDAHEHDHHDAEVTLLTSLLNK